METLFGVMARMDQAMILHNDVRYFASVRDELIDLTVQYGQLNHLELAVDGYDDDKRSLYEIPEVRRWVQKNHVKWTDSLFWLTPGTLWFYVLCLNPGMYSRLSNGQLQIAFDTDKLLPQFEASHRAGVELLIDAGIAEDKLDAVIGRAQQNVMQMFDRKKLGDYVVVHPKTGEILTYQR